jgi:lipoprotein-releasing system permease protein
MNLSTFIARRYLFAKKSHNVINIISGISAAGIAIGCAALVVIMSIYNGFDSIIRTLYNSYTPDLLVTPAEGKVFTTDSEGFEEIRGDAAVLSFCEVLEENVFVTYGDNHIVATARGVDSAYISATGLKDYVVEGNFELEFGALKQVVIGHTLAQELGLRIAFVAPLDVYFPSRTTEVSQINPFASLRSERLHPGGIISLDQNFDKKYMFLPVETLRSLLEYDDEVTSVEIYADSGVIAPNGVVTADFQKRVSALLGDSFTVKNRQQQNESLYKLLSYEKIAIYAILLFVMIIISCNIFGSLSMLIIEKRDDIEILKSMGADDRLIKKIFVKEGWLISLLGIVAGIALGLLVCLLQQKVGLVKMPGNFIVEYYPVVIRWSDILIIAGGVGLIGYLAAVVSRAAN